MHVSRDALFSVYGGSLEVGMCNTWPVGSFVLFLGANGIMSNRRKHHNMVQRVSSSDENSRPFLHSCLNRAPI